MRALHYGMTIERAGSLGSVVSTNRKARTPFQFADLARLPTFVAECVSNNYRDGA